MKGVWRRRSDRRRWIRETAIGLLMLPLSFVPIWLYAAHTGDGYLMYLRGRYTIYPPSTPELRASDVALVSSNRRLQVDGVPVLVYHGIGRSSSDTIGDDRYVVSRSRFAEQMRLLQRLGFTAIDTAELAGYLQHDASSSLPPKPILITFDDGRTDAMLQADPILRDTGMRATMFIIGSKTTSGSFYYEQQAELRHFASTGRWDLEAHTYDLHHLVSSPGGPRSALVAVLPHETMKAYAERVSGDTDREDATIRDLSGKTPDAFAYPYGDWARNVPAVASVLQHELAGHYSLAFDQDGQSGWRFALPGDNPLHVHRLQVANWTGPEFMERLSAAARLSKTTYDERGIGLEYSARELATAALDQPKAPEPATDVVRSVDTGGRKLIALTFDNGPSPFTPQVLDELDRYHQHGTFFVRSGEVAGARKLLQRMLVSADEVATDVAPTPTLRPTKPAGIRLERATTAVESALPTAPTLTRAFDTGATPFAQIARRHGLQSIGWSIDPGDDRNPAPAAIAKRVLAALSPGAIVILHDGGDSERWRTVQALPAILDGLRARGYRSLTVSGLLRAGVTTSREQAVR